MSISTLLFLSGNESSIYSIFSEIFSPSTLLSIFYKVLSALIILLVFYLLGRYLEIFIDRFLVRIEEDLRKRFSDIGRYVIYSIGILIAIAILSPEPFTFSILLLLIGLGVIVTLSDVLRNWGSELYIRVVRPFKLGDWIEIGDKSGRVIKIDNLGIVIETIDRVRIHVPNVVLTREVITNRTTPYGVVFKIIAEFPKEIEEISVSKYITEVLDEIRPELVDDPRLVYKGIMSGKSIFEITIAVINVRKIEKLFEHISRRIREQWPSARVHM
ncbi:MAG: mechanosensitive ion channel domain-containing protein [Sulfolobales archaeon]